MNPPPQTTPGFWEGYRIWLGQKRKWWLTLGVLVLATFLIALWASAAPEDPFAYAAFR